MWSDYIKGYAFRDCFDSERNIGNVEAINKLLQIKQLDGTKGTIISTDLISTEIATKFEAYQLEDTKEWILKFYNDKACVATIIISDYKEIQLEFEIEENSNNGGIKIHCCIVKGFKEYQM